MIELRGWRAVMKAAALGALISSANCGGNVVGAPSDGGGAERCGNGIVEGKEECDGSNFNSESCRTATLGTMPFGTLKCTRSCTLDTTGCSRGGSGGSGGSQSCGARPCGGYGGYGTGGSAGYGTGGYGGYGTGGYAGAYGAGGYDAYGTGGYAGAYGAGGYDSAFDTGLGVFDASAGN